MLLNVDIPGLGVPPEEVEGQGSGHVETGGEVMRVLVEIQQFNVKSLVEVNMVVTILTRHDDI